MTGHDIIVIGASAGGLQIVLSIFVEYLRLPATVSQRCRIQWAESELAVECSHGQENEKAPQHASLG
jgi:hypothetical protein